MLRGSNTRRALERKGDPISLAILQAYERELARSKRLKPRTHTEKRGLVFKRR